MNGEDQNPLAEIDGLCVRLQDGSVVLRHRDCSPDEEDAILGLLVREPDGDENYVDAVDELYRCYVCAKPVNTIWHQTWAR